jgi:hypothetical protein
LLCRSPLGPEAFQRATADLCTALFEVAVKFEQHSRRVFVLLDCSPIGSDICHCRNRRLDADGWQDVLNQEKSRHERAIRQRVATATGGVTGADEFVERFGSEEWLFSSPR